MRDEIPSPVPPALCTNTHHTTHSPVRSWEANAKPQRRQRACTLCAWHASSVRSCCCCWSNATTNYDADGLSVQQQATGMNEHIHKEQQIKQLTFMHNSSTRCTHIQFLMHHSPLPITTWNLLLVMLQSCMQQRRSVHSHKQDALATLIYHLCCRVATAAW